ncbi:hypothetical protein [Arthrobacter pigmenti]
MRKLAATVHRDGPWCEVLIPELGQLTATQCYDEIEEYAVDLAASVLDQPHNEISVTITMGEEPEVQQP